MESRETLAESRPSGSPMAKLQKQLRIRLQRLPDHVLQSAALCLPHQMLPCVDGCIAETNPPLSLPVTQPGFSGPSCPIAISTPEPSQPKTLSASPQRPHAPTNAARKNLVLRLHRLHLSKLLPPSLAEPSVEHPAELCVDETNVGKSLRTVVARPPQTDGLAAELQEEVQERQQQEVDSGGTQHEEEKQDSSVEETVLPSCQTSDPHCVLRSQTPAECASVNTLTGLSNGFNQKGLLQNKHKIRVDFKVSLC